MFSTSEDGYALIKRFEGCKLAAYRPTDASNWTIGWGSEGYLYDGREITEGLTITQAEADDQFAWVMHNHVDPLTRAHFVCKTQEEFDACASWVFNIRWGKLQRGEYSLPALVNRSDRSPEAVSEIIDKWMQYWRTPGAENGLYRRRILELIRFMGLPWNVPEVLGQVMMAKALPVPTDPETVFNVADAVYERTAEPPKSENQITADLNDGQLAKLQGKAPIAAPKLDPAAPLKPMEQSVTAKGMAQKKAGQDQLVTGAITTTVAGVGIVKEVTSGVKDVSETAHSAAGFFLGLSLSDLITIGALVGMIWLVVGVIRWQSGRIRMAVGRQEAESGKI